MEMCKQKEITTIIIGHVTKDGNIAGPRVLEHMVDTVLYLEGERYFSYRILRGVKNRFGSTNEIGMFEMQNEGLVEIKNPSELLISERDGNPAGSVIVVSIEGTRALVLELQALSTPTVFGMPRRNANGIDYNRVTLLMAVLEKRAGINLGSQDVYINLVGGIKVNEPALDLGIILAAASSFKNISIKDDPEATALSYQTVTGEVIIASEATTNDTTTQDTGIPKTETPKKEEPKDETPSDTTGDTSKDTSSDTTGDTSRDTSSDKSSDTSRDTSSDTSSDTSRDTTSDTPHEEPPSDTPSTPSETLDYYFAHAAEEKLNSSDIAGWGDYIKQFLEENNLSTYVKDITIEDGVITCTLVNDKKFEYTNVTGIVDLLKKLQTSILKDTGGTNA